MFFAHVGTKRNDLQGLGIQKKFPTIVWKTVLSFPYCLWSWVQLQVFSKRSAGPGRGSGSKMDELMRLCLIGGHLFLDSRVQLHKWQVTWMTWMSTDFRAWMSRLSPTSGQDLSESKVQAMEGIAMV